MIAATSMETIVKLLSELRPILLLVEIPVKQLKVREGNHSTKACGRAFDWLHNIKMSVELKEYKDIRALLPEAIWERYTLFGIEGLREQRLLERAAQKLRARWRKKRPAMFNSDLKRKGN